MDSVDKSLVVLLEFPAKSKFWNFVMMCWVMFGFSILFNPLVPMLYRALVGIPTGFFFGFWWSSLPVYYKKLGGLYG